MGLGVAVGVGVGTGVGSGVGEAGAALTVEDGEAVSETAGTELEELFSPNQLQPEKHPHTKIIAIHIDKIRFTL